VAAARPADVPAELLVLMALRAVLPDHSLHLGVTLGSDDVVGLERLPKLRDVKLVLMEAVLQRIMSRR